MSVGGMLSLQGTVDAGIVRGEMEIPDHLTINLGIDANLDENQDTDSTSCYLELAVGGQANGTVDVDVDVPYLEVLHAMTNFGDAGELITALGLMGQREAVVAKLFDVHGVAVLAEALDGMSTGFARESMLDDLEALLKAHRG